MTCAEAERLVRMRLESLSAAVAARGADDLSREDYEAAERRLSIAVEALRDAVRDADDASDARRWTPWRPVLRCLAGGRS